MRFRIETIGKRFAAEDTVEVVNLAEKFSKFKERWSPRIAGEINDFYVKLVKVEGEFVWHSHEKEDELFLVLVGELRMRFRHREELIGPGEFIIVPHGVEHMPMAEVETHVLLLEPKSTLNTGNVRNERTLDKLKKV
jgi:mannose-6-phosphate isomerase-like protein (cupin superfamily)